MNRETMSPAEALESAGAARAQLAALGNCPPWRHAAFGAVMGLLILGLGFPIGVQAACMCLAMGGVVLIAANDRRHYGVFINGYRKGPTLPVTGAILLSMIGLIFAQIYFRDQRADVWVPFAIAGIAFVIGIAGSVWWSRVFRREMERAA